MRVHKLARSGALGQHEKVLRKDRRGEHGGLGFEWERGVLAGQIVLEGWHDHLVLIHTAVGPAGPFVRSPLPLWPDWKVIPLGRIWVISVEHAKAWRDIPVAIGTGRVQ